MSSRIIPLSYSKINPAKQRTRRPRPHGHPRPDRYRPPTRPARYALDVGRAISLVLPLEKNRIAPNAATLAKIGGGE